MKIKANSIRELIQLIIHNIIEPIPRIGDRISLDLAVTPLISPFNTDKKEMKPDEVVWGNLKNCWLPGILASMANTPLGQEQIRRMITMDDKIIVQSSTYDGRKLRTQGLIKIRFLNYPKPISISRLLYRYKTPQPGEKIADIYYGSSKLKQGWVSFIEKAYVILEEGRLKESLKKGNIFQIVRGYAILEKRMNEIALWQDFILGPNRKPNIIKIQGRNNVTAIKNALQQAKIYPTTATTPIPPSKNIVNTKDGLWADHVYAIIGMKKIKEKSGKVGFSVSLFGDSDIGIEECSLGIFLENFDHITQCKIKRLIIPLKTQ